MQNQKMSSNKKRALILMLAVALVVSAAFAFMTATDTKENVFTIGKVNVALREDNWFDDEGNVINDENDNGTPDFADDIIPGDKIEKAPYVENTGNNEAYVYVLYGIPVAPTDSLYADENGNYDFEDVTSTNIPVWTYAIQRGYKDATDAATTWSAYVTEKGWTPPDAGSARGDDLYSELFTTKYGTGEDAPAFNSDCWERISFDEWDDYDNYSYYLYVYVDDDTDDLLPAGEETDPIFTSVTFKSDIGTNADVHTVTVCDPSGDVVSRIAYTNLDEEIDLPGSSNEMFSGYQVNESTYKPIITSKLTPRDVVPYTQDGDGDIVLTELYASDLKDDHVRLIPYEEAGENGYKSNVVVDRRGESEYDPANSMWYVYGFEDLIIDKYTKAGTRYDFDNPTETQQNNLNGKTIYSRNMNGTTVRFVYKRNLLNNVESPDTEALNEIYRKPDLETRLQLDLHVPDGKLGRIGIARNTYGTRTISTGALITVYETNTDDTDFSEETIVEQFYYIFFGDIDGNGSVRSADVTWSDNIVKGIKTEEKHKKGLADKINLIDTDDNGVFSYNEMKVYNQSEYSTEAELNAYVDSLFAEFDLDKNGEFNDKEKLLSINSTPWEVVFMAADINGDNEVDAFETEMVACVELGAWAPFPQNRGVRNAGFVCYYLEDGKGVGCFLVTAECTKELIVNKIDAKVVWGSQNTINPVSSTEITERTGNVWGTGNTVIADNVYLFDVKRIFE